MSLQTPKGPGSGPPPQKYLSCTCPSWHLKDLQVVPHPQILSSISYSAVKTNSLERKHNNPRWDLCFTECVSPLFHQLTKMIPRSMHTFWYKCCTKTKVNMTSSKRRAIFLSLKNSSPGSMAFVLKLEIKYLGYNIGQR